MKYPYSARDVSSYLHQKHRVRIFPELVRSIFRHNLEMSYKLGKSWPVNYCESNTNLMKGIFSLKIWRIIEIWTTYKYWWSNVFKIYKSFVYLAKQRKRIKSKEHMIFKFDIINNGYNLKWRCLCSRYLWVRNRKHHHQIYWWTWDLPKTKGKDLFIKLIDNFR